MPTVRIFISSPNDVAEERAKARDVIEQLQRAYGDRVRLVHVFWEDLAPSIDCSVQQKITKVLSDGGVDIAVFILWSRLGSPLSEAATPRPDGGAYRSGTEHEFDLMLAAREASGGIKPDILAYWRQDEKSFIEGLKQESPSDYPKLLEQREMARRFIAERFMDEHGRNIRGLHSFPEPFTFASRLRAHLKELIDPRLEGTGTAVAWEGDPFRAFEVFDLAHADIFHGREVAVADLEALLRGRASCPFAVVVGPSGSGKSSLVRAGLASNLVRYNLDPDIAEWRHAVFLPSSCGGQLLHGLANQLFESTALPELREAGLTLANLADRLEHQPPDVIDVGLALKRAAQKAKGPVRLFLVVDQLEEIYTDKRITPESRTHFYQVLGALATTGCVWIAATLRSDFYAIAQQDRAFLDLKDPDGQFDLLPPEPSALQRIIREPARLAGLTFEHDERTGRTLDEDLLRDASAHPDALPLLEYALQQLFEHRSPRGVLTFAAYTALGGVEGAIGNRAAQTFAGLPETSQRALEEILPLLVTVDTGIGVQAIRRYAPLADLTASEARRALTHSLIAARFLTTSEQGGIPVAAFAHEALLRRWDRLQAWLTENRELLEIREQIRLAALDWTREKNKANGRPHDLLLAAGVPLSRGQRVQEAGLLNDEEVQFVKCSAAKAKAERDRKRRNLQIVAAAAAAAIVILSFATWQATRKTQEVKRLLAESDAERAERLFAEDDAGQAMVYLARSVSAGVPLPRTAERLWFALTQRSWPRPVFDPVQQDAEITAVSFAPGGDQFATATRDGKVTLFSSDSGQPLGVPLAHPKSVRGILYSPDGHRLLTGCDDAEARLWSVEKSSATLLGHCVHEDAVAGIAWSHDGTRFATASWDKRVRVWDAGSPSQPLFTGPMKDKVHTVAFHPRKPHLVLGVAKDTACVWDTDSGAVVLQYEAPEDLNGARFSADGSKVLSFGIDGDVAISDLDSGSQQWAQLALGEACRDAAFSPDGALFAVAFGSQVRAYTLQQPPSLLWEHKFPGLVSQLKFTTEGKRLLTACDDGRVQVFDSHTGQSLSEPIIEPGIPGALDFHAVGNRVLLARSTHTVRIWNLALPAPLPIAQFRQGSPPRLLTANRDIVCVAENGQAMALNFEQANSAIPQSKRFAFGTALTSAAVHPSGAVVGGATDGRVLFADKDKITEIGKQEAPIGQLAFSADGNLLAAGDDSGHLNVWKWPQAVPQPLAEHHHDQISGLSFLGAGHHLFSASWDHTLALSPLGNPPGAVTRWPVKGEPQAVATDPAHRFVLAALSSREVWIVKGEPPEAGLAFTIGNPPSCASISADGALAAVGTVAGTIEVWNLQTRAKLLEIRSGDARVNAVAFEPNHHWLAIGTEDGQARIFDLSSGWPVSEVIPHSSAVRHLLFAKEGSWLVTAARDGSVWVWPLLHSGDSKAAVAIADRIANDPRQRQRFVPRAELGLKNDDASLRQLIEILQREGADDFRPEIDLYESYLATGKR